MRVTLPPINFALSLEEIRLVARKASVPCLCVRNLTARVQSVPHRQRSMPKASIMRQTGSQMSLLGERFERQRAGAGDFYGDMRKFCQREHFWQFGPRLLRLRRHMRLNPHEQIDDDLRVGIAADQRDALVEPPGDVQV